MRTRRNLQLLDAARLGEEGFVALLIFKLSFVSANAQELQFRAFNHPTENLRAIVPLTH